MNIKTQCCGLAILIVILYFYFYHKKVNMKTERAFFGFLMAVFTTVCLDIISIWGIVHVHLITPVIREILCKLYVISVMTAVYAALIYVCVDIYTNVKLFKRIRVAYNIILAVSFVCIMALPIEYIYQPEEGLVYTAGASVYIGYILGLIFLFSLIYHIVFRSKRMNSRRRNAIGVWLIIWILATIFQFSIKGFLLFSFAMALGVVIVYLFLENPEMNLDRNTGVFNQIALLQYVPQLYNEGKKFAALELVVESGMDSAAQEISDILLAVKGAQSFRYSTNNVMMLFEYGSDVLKVKEQITDRFEEGFGEDHNNIMRPYWYYMPDSSVVRTSKDFLNVIKFAHHNVLDKTNTDITFIEQAMADNMYRRERITKLLEQALEEDKIEVFYQPIYSTVEKRFLSAEALVRIRDENEEIILPGRFIDIAEKNGMILKLGEMVFEKVCRFVSDPMFDTLGLKHIEINLSIAQCVQRSLAADYIFIMNKYNVDPSRINLEITETASVSAKMILLENMSILRENGVRFSLDDFGTGNSNLNYIVDMPVDILKFDMGMTKSYFEDDKAHYVMDATIKMVQGMDMQIVFEGVETEEQLATTENLGIEYIQGFYFARPMPEDEFCNFLRKHLKGLNSPIDLG